MTIYSFSPGSVTAIQNWSDPSIWSTRSVPNSTSAEVLLPEITNLQSGQPVLLTINIQAGQSFQADDLDILYGTISNSGTLTVAHDVTVGTFGGLYNDLNGGALIAQSFENYGQITSSGPYMISGTAINRGTLYGNFTITAGTFDNAGGTLQSTGALTVAAGNFANLSNGTLTGGTYLPLAGAITFDVNGPIGTLAATVIIGSFTLQTYAATGTSLVTLQASLASVAPSGFLLVEDFTPSYTNSGPLSVAGVLASANTLISVPSLSIASSGIVSLNSSVSNPIGGLTASGGIVDNGTIIATLNSFQEGDGSYLNSPVVISGAVSGSGVIVIGPSVSFYSSATMQQGRATVSVELAGADTAGILFADNGGTLKLDAPQSVTGAIKGFTQGDTIILSGITLSSVVSTTYAGNSTGGVLTITQSGGPTVALSLLGNYYVSDFFLSPGPQPLSTSPPSVMLTTTNSLTQSYNTVESASAAAPIAGSEIVAPIADVAANLDALQTLVAAGKISNVLLTDFDLVAAGQTLPSMTVTANQFQSDGAALHAIDSAYTIAVTGATVAQAESIAGAAHVTSIIVSDSSVHIGPQIDALQQLAATGQLSSIAVTDSGFIAFFLTSAQLANDRAALTEMSGNFNLSVTASAANIELDGITGHALSAVFSGTASQYAIASIGDGIGVTITDTGTGRTSVDLLRSVSAVQFADFTDLIAHTPGFGAAGSVTTGNVAELYGAVFGRLPDLPGLAYYQNILAQNPTLPLTTFAQWFLASPEYANNPAHNYAQNSAGDTQFITDSYTNLLHRAPESGAVPFYLTIIQSFTNGLTPGTPAYAAAQAQAHAGVLADFSNSPEFLQDVQVTAQTPSSAQHWLILI